MRGAGVNELKYAWLWDGLTQDGALIHSEMMDAYRIAFPRKAHRPAHLQFLLLTYRWDYIPKRWRARLRPAINKVLARREVAGG